MNILLACLFPLAAWYDHRRGTFGTQHACGIALLGAWPLAREWPSWESPLHGLTVFGITLTLLSWRRRSDLRARQAARQAARAARAKAHAARGGTAALVERTGPPA